MSDARSTVYRPIDGLSMHKRIAAANIYSELCCIQGRLEDVPTVIHVEVGGGDGQQL